MRTLKRKNETCSIARDFVRACVPCEGIIVAERLQTYSPNSTLEEVLLKLIRVGGCPISCKQRDEVAPSGLGLEKLYGLGRACGSCQRQNLLFGVANYLGLCSFR